MVPEYSVAVTGFEVAIGEGNGAEARVNLDGVDNAMFRFLEVAKLAGVASQIEMDRRILWMLALRLQKNCLGGCDIRRATDSKG